MTESDRDLSDREVAMILRRATELQDESGEGLASHGLSLEVVREIAEEIGVESRFVDEAASSVLEGGTTQIVLGGPIRERLGASYARTLSEEETSELVGRIRRVLKRQGEVSQSLGSVEWRTGDVDSLAVTISPRGDETDIQIIGDRSGSLVPTLAIPSVAGLAVAAIIVDGLQPGTFEGLSILGTGIVGGLAFGRAIWWRTSRSLRRRLEALQDDVRRYMEGSEGEDTGELDSPGGVEAES
jgi:hypothetical protein